MAQKKNLSQSIKFAESVEKELVKSGRQDRGVHQAGFWVLWATSMPSVLVELDFICNPESAKYLSSDKGAKELAEAIFKAVQLYESSWKKNNNISGNSELTDTYTEGSEGNLEDSYLVSVTPVTKTRVRVHNNLSINKNSDIRRRRSARSKLLSDNKSYEKDNLIFSGDKQYFTVMEQEDRVEALELADLGNNKDKGKKAEKKKKEKEPKKKTEKQPKKRRDDAYSAKVNKLMTVYKIQILASSDLLSQENSRFCGLSPISTYKENNLYKYFYGESTDKSEIEAVLSDVRKKIPDAFIVSSTKTVQVNK